MPEQPDGLGRLVQPPDAVHHADRRLVFLPIVLAYTAWVFRVLRGEVTLEHIGDSPACTDRARREEQRMWYFSWILGLGLALVFGVLNAMWYELRESERRGETKS